MGVHLPSFCPWLFNGEDEKFEIPFVHGRRRKERGGENHVSVKTLADPATFFEKMY
jgi:hypothetical protein